MNLRDRYYWWRRRVVAPVGTPGNTTVTLNSSGTWSPGSVTGANTAQPLIVRVYGAGGNGGLPEEGQGGGGGGGGGFIQYRRDTWTTGDSYTIDIGTPGNTTYILDGAGDLAADSGGNAAGQIPGLGAPAGYDEGFAGGEVTAAYAGGNGGAGSGGGMGGGGGASGSVGGAGGAGDSGGSAGVAASADGGNGGYGGDGDVGGGGFAPGGGAGGSGEPSDQTAVGANGRVVIIVPTLT